jgi:hypothetical protein
MPGGKPQRPKTGYQRWSAENWQSIQKENPNFTQKEFDNLLAAKWAELPAEKKGPYNKLWKDGMKVYKIDLWQWEADMAEANLETKNTMEKTMQEMQKMVNAGYTEQQILDG